MKYTFNYIGDVIKRAAETRASLIKMRAAEQMGFISRNISIVAIAGATVILLLVLNLDQL